MSISYFLMHYVYSEKTGTRYNNTLEPEMQHTLELTPKNFIQNF